MEQVITWLTEANHPYVEYLTRKNILGEKVNKKNSSETIGNIANREPVSIILGKQDREGWWGESDNYSFNPLYKNTFWQLYFLSLMGITKSISGIDKAVGLVVSHILKDNGSFTSNSGYPGNLCCLVGQFLEMLLRLGYVDHSFTKK